MLSYFMLFKRLLYDFPWFWGFPLPCFITRIGDICLQTVTTSLQLNFDEARYAVCISSYNGIDMNTQWFGYWDAHFHGFFPMNFPISMGFHGFFHSFHGFSHELRGLLADLPFNGCRPASRAPNIPRTHMSGMLKQPWEITRINIMNI